MTRQPKEATNLLELADQVEKLTGPDRELDCLIFEAQHLLLMPNHRGTIDGEPTGEYFDQSGNQLPERAPFYTRSLDAIRSLGGMVVFASDIGADGLAVVKIVADTSTSPIVEHTGIAAKLEMAWLAAALRARAQESTQ